MCACGFRCNVLFMTPSLYNYYDSSFWLGVMFKVFSINVTLMIIIIYYYYY